jgi:hypothetical protein
MDLMKGKLSIKRVIVAVFVALVLIFIFVIGYFVGLPTMVERKIRQYSSYSFSNVLVGGEPCVKEGSRGNAFVDIKVDCCAGLKRSAITYRANNRCEVELSGSFVCIDCGNGVCEPEENTCNCELDCSE